ncbi:MAG: nucleotidyltransferase domain-containing protein [Desulfobacterales bacterium]|nr:nucleotidyltransferase domain-containing protein [Desulfobacterales bacterium]
MDALEKQILGTFKLLMMKRAKVHRVALFGSRARGDADPDSDMDVLVVLDDLTRELEDYISECAWQAGFEHGIVLVPVVFSRNEWENGPERYSLLAEAIRSEGVYL